MSFIFRKHIKIVKVKKVKVGDRSPGLPESSFSVAITHWSVGVGATYFPELLQFTLETYFIMLSVKQGCIKYDFLSLWYDSTSHPAHWRTLGLMSRAFANCPGDQVSIPGRVITKTPKMLLDVALLNTQHYKVRIKGKEGQSRERSRALPYTSV